MGHFVDLYTDFPLFYFFSAHNASETKKEERNLAIFRENSQSPELKIIFFDRLFRAASVRLQYMPL